MNKSIVSLIVLFFSYTLYSQVEFIGTVQEGLGKDHAIFTANSSSAQSLLKEHLFTAIPGRSSAGTKTIIDNQIIYGTTKYGGKFNKGILFKYDILKDEFSVLHNFIDEPQKSSLSEPEGGLFLYKNVLYGTASYKGRYRNHKLFKYNLESDVFTFLDNQIFGDLNFDCNLIEYKDDTLIGASFSGGVNNKGFIYKYSTLSDAIIPIADFENYSAGKNPSGYFVKAANGIYYGYCLEDKSSFEDPILYRFDSKSLTIQTAEAFPRSWSAPNYGDRFTDLVVASDSFLIGVSDDGGYYEDGVLFTHNIYTGVTQLKVDLGQYRDDGSISKIVKGSNGKFYGNVYGSIPDQGIYGGIFEFDLAQNSYSIIKNLTKTDLKGYYSHMVEDVNRDFYGVSASGGIVGGGGLFKFNISTNEQSTVFEFGQSEGIQPWWTIEVNDSIIYGNTYRGGDNNYGILYKFNRITKDFKPLLSYNKDSLIGYGLTGKYIPHSNGMVYGYTHYAGGNYSGTLFSINPSTDSIKKLVDFGETIQQLYDYSLKIELDNKSLFGSYAYYQNWQRKVGFYEYKISTNEQVHYPELIKDNKLIVPFGDYVQTGKNEILFFGNYDDVYNSTLLFLYNLNSDEVTIVKDFSQTFNNGIYRIFKLNETNRIIVMAYSQFEQETVFEYLPASNHINIVENERFGENSDGVINDNCPFVLGRNNRLYGILNKGDSIPNWIVEYDFISGKTKEVVQLFGTDGNSFIRLTELKTAYNLRNKRTQPKPFLFPNPIVKSGLVVLDAVANKVEFKIYNFKGKLVQDLELYQTKEINFELDGVEGVYIINITADGKDLESIKCLKYLP